MGGKLLNGVRIERKYIAQLTEHFVTSVFPAMTRSQIQGIIVAGSYRRGKDVSGDIELVIPCDTMSEYAWVRGKIVKQFGSTESSGPKMSGLWGQVQFDLFPCHRHQMGSMLLHATGSWEFNKEMRTRARNLGMKLNQYGLFRINSDTPFLVDETEEKFFKYIEMDYVDPKDR